MYRFQKSIQNIALDIQNQRKKVNIIFLAMLNIKIF